MSSKNSSNIYEILKLLGVKKEAELNRFVHALLNDKKIIHLVNNKLTQHSQSLKKFRQFNELLALQLNTPTKDDVANVAKIGIQMEEKLDVIDEKLSIIIEELQQGHRRIKNNKELSLYTNEKVLLPQVENPQSIDYEIQKIKDDAALRRLNKLNLLLNPMNMKDEN